MNMEELEKIVENAKKGDRMAFNKIVNMYQKMVTKVAYSFTHNYFDADDIAQETFIKAFFKLTSLKNNAHINYWLYSITINIAKNYLKRKRKNELSFDDEIGTDYNYENTPEDEAINIELKNMINKSIEKLPYNQKAVILLKRDQNLKFREIAEVMKISTSAVKTHYSRAVKKLKKYLKRGGFYENM